MLDLNLNLNLGLASVFGDPTALTQNNADSLFTSLGLTQAGTGTTWGETGNDETPLYPVAAGKVPLAVEEINGKNYFGPIVNPAGTNLALHDRNATNAAWVKTGCTAELALGGLEHNSDWEDDELVEAGWTADTGWAQNGRTFTATNVAANTEVEKSSLCVAGKFYRIRIDFSGLSVNSSWRFYLSQFTGVFDIAQVSDGTSGSKDIIALMPASGITALRSLGGPASGTFIVSIVEVDAHTLITSTSTNATAVTSITSTSGERVSKFWLSRESGSGTVSITQDNGSTWTDVSLGATPLSFDIDAATLANPTIGIRITTSGDSVRLYGVEHQVAARPLRPYIGPTSSSTVTSGARSLTRTGLSSISEIDVELVLMAAPSSPNTAFAIDDETTSNVLYMEHTGSAFTVRRVLSSTTSQLANIDIAPGVIGKLDIQLSGSVFRARLNNGSWVTGTGGMPSGLSRIRIGSNGSAQRQWERPILAFRDNIGNLLDGNLGWNHSLLDNWT